MKKQVLIVIGRIIIFGKKYEGNAFELAKTPTFDKLLSDYPNSKIQFSRVNMYSFFLIGQMGNSRWTFEYWRPESCLHRLSLINQLIKTVILENPIFLNAIKKSKNNKRTLHLVGLLSDGKISSRSFLN